MKDRRYAMTREQIQAAQHAAKLRDQEDEDVRLIERIFDLIAAHPVLKERLRTLLGIE